MKIDVSNIIDKELATFVDDGILLHKEIKKYLDKNEKVIVDFSNIKMVISSFLNAAIGKLYGDFQYNFIENNLEIIGLDEDDEELLNDVVIPNAKSFFEKKDKIANIENKIIYQHCNVKTLPVLA
jgi:hypothetical protein